MEQGKQKNPFEVREDKTAPLRELLSLIDGNPEMLEQDEVKQVLGLAAKFLKKDVERAKVDKVASEHEMPTVFQEVFEQFKQNKIPYRFEVKVNYGEVYRDKMHPDQDRRFEGSEVFCGGGRQPEVKVGGYNYEHYKQQGQDYVRIVATSMQFVEDKNLQLKDRPLLVIMWKGELRVDERDDFNCFFEFTLDKQIIDQILGIFKNNPKSWQTFIRGIDPEILDVTPIKKEPKFLVIENLIDKKGEVKIPFNK